MNEMNVSYFWVSEMGLMLRLSLFMSGGLFITSWETFMGCDYMKGGKEFLKLDKCGVKMMSDKLKGS